MEAFDELLGYVWIVLFAHTGLPLRALAGVVILGSLACEGAVCRPGTESSIECFLGWRPPADVSVGERTRFKF